MLTKKPEKKTKSGNKNRRPQPAAKQGSNVRDLLQSNQCRKWNHTAVYGVSQQQTTTSCIFLTFAAPTSKTPAFACGKLESPRPKRVLGDSFARFPVQPGHGLPLLVSPSASPVTEFAHRSFATPEPSRAGSPKQGAGTVQTGREPVQMWTTQDGKRGLSQGPGIRSSAGLQTPTTGKREKNPSSLG